MIRKPDSLKRRLASSLLNPHIFIWELRVGDWIEEAIDCVIDKVNLVLLLAKEALNKAQEAWDYARELANCLGETICREVQSVIDNISTWWDQLNEWWEAKRAWVQDVIDASITRLKSLVLLAQLAIAKVEAAWDNFRKDTLPGLFTIERWTSFWGGRIDTISDWWGARRQQVSDMIDTAVKPVRDEVNKHSGQLDSIKQLLTDPEKWLLDRIESMIARFL